MNTKSRRKKELRGLFFLLVITSAMTLALAAYFDIEAHKAGADAPTVEKTVENIQHGRKKYILPAESARIQLMWTLFLIGFPATMLFGILLHFAFKVNISEEETLPPWIEKLKNDVKENRL